MTGPDHGRLMSTRAVSSDFRILDKFGTREMVDNDTGVPFGVSNPDAHVSSDADDNLGEESSRATTVTTWS
jgi:hypothetical protein